MSACKHHKETLMLDIYNELNQDLKPAWDKHLSNCAACRAEKKAIIQTLGEMKTALTAPSLGEAEAAAMRKRVIRELSNGGKAARVKRRAFSLSRAFVPALASACVLLVALGFVISKSLTGPGINNGNHLIAYQEQLPEEDLDIINNLDLLKDLDALDKLSEAIDQSQSPSRKNNIQGKSGYDSKPIFS